MLTSESIRVASTYSARKHQKVSRSLSPWQVLFLILLAVAGVLVAFSVGLGAAMFVLPVMAIGTNGE